MKKRFNIVVFTLLFYQAVSCGRLMKRSILLVGSVNYIENKNYLLPNSRTTISCNYTNQKHKIEWFDPSGHLISSSSGKRISVQKHVVPFPRGDKMSAVLLTITDTQIGDTGQYECRSGDMIEKSSLCIIDPLEFIDTPTFVTVDEGRSYTLLCQARGAPEPRLIWLRNDEEINDDGNSSKYKVMTKYKSQGFEGLLTITSLVPEDSGTYICKAVQEHTALEECGLTKNISVTVLVNYAPVFVNVRDTIIYGKINESINLACEAKGYPTPTYRWFHKLDATTLYQYSKNRFELSGDQSISNFTVVANALSFGQNYICEASNEFGKSKKLFRIVMLDKPKRPTEVNVFNISINQMEVCVSWLEPVLFPVESVTVQYMTEIQNIEYPEEDNWKQAKVLNLEDIRLEADAAIVKLSGLESNTTYWMRLCIVNEIGSSPWSDPIVIYTEEDEEVLELTTAIGINEDYVNLNPTEFLKYGLIYFVGGLLVILICFVGLLR